MPRINLTAERLEASGINATREADELCEQFQSFTGRAQDWMKESEAQHKKILDHEVTVAKMVAAMLSMYQPKALDAMHDVLEKLQQIALDDNDNDNGKSNGNDIRHLQKQVASGVADGEEEGESSSSSSSSSPPSLDNDVDDDDVNMQDDGAEAANIIGGNFICTPGLVH